MAWAGAWLALTLAPIHALSRYATADGKADLDSSFVRAWAEPAARALKPLLDWSDAQTVYVSYGKAWFFPFVAAMICAFVVKRNRAPSTRVELWAWRVSLTGLVLATASTFGDYWTPWLDESFLFLGIPGMLTSIFGSMALGVSLLRHGFRPRLTAVLLATWLPLFVLLSSVIAMGAAALPMLFAWGIAGRRLAANASSVTAVTPTRLSGQVR